MLHSTAVSQMSGDSKPKPFFFKVSNSALLLTQRVALKRFSFLYLQRIVAVVSQSNVTSDHMVEQKYPKCSQKLL